MADTSTFAGAASGALSGAAAGTAIAPGIGTIIGGAVGLIGGLFGSKKSGSSTPTYQPLDISKVITEARTAAQTNYANSIALEQQYRPGTAALRTQTDAAISNLFNGNTQAQQTQRGLLDSLGGNYGTNPLLEESANRILHNLKLGGTLGADVQAQAMQAALEKGGAAGISGSGAARGLVARDLGLTSLGLEQQRIQQAQTAGQAQAQLNLNNLSTRAGIINNVAGLDTQRYLNLAQLVDARPLPGSGLTPGDIGSLYVADNNAKNQFATDAAKISTQQRNANLASLLGLGSQVAGSGNALSAIGSLFKGSGQSSAVDVPLGTS